MVLTGYDAAHLLEVVEHPLDTVAVSVTPPACFLWKASAFSGGNNRQDPMDHQIQAEAVTVMAPIRASLTVTLGMDFDRKAATWSITSLRMSPLLRP